MALDGITLMLTRLKLLGVIVSFIGIFAAFADLIGWFADSEKLHIANLVWNSEGGIPRGTPGFEKFLEAFPPSEGVNPDRITHIVKNVLKWEAGPTFGGAVRYLANGERSEAVATFDQVQRWAEKTNYAWYSWTPAAFGWLVVASIELFEYWSQRGKEGDQPNA
jgi:hypothetical protein